MGNRTFFCHRLLAPAGWLRDVVVDADDEGLIQSIGKGDHKTAEVELTGPVIPGMPNCHSHAFQRQMAGLAGSAGPDGADSFWTWRDAMYRLANRVSPEALEAIAQWLYVEMLESGYTSCAEFHYLHHGPDGQPMDQVDEMSVRVLSAGSSAGIALTLLPVLYCRAGFANEDVLPEQRRFANSPQGFLRLFERVLDRLRDEPHHVVGLALHSLRAVSLAQIDEVLSAVGDRAVAVHIHIAEQRAEVSQCIAAYGARPVQWALENLPVDRRWCLVHATHMQPGEYEAAAARGAVAGLCPTTEADLGDGFFEAGEWVNQGGRFAIGSDSNLRISPREELRLLEFGLRLRTGRRNVLVADSLNCGRFLYEEAALGGAGAIGQAAGAVSEGLRADLVELDPSHPMLQGVQDDDLIDRYVFAGDRTMIRSVFVGGRQLVHNGQHEARQVARSGFLAAVEELAK